MNTVFEALQIFYLKKKRIKIILNSQKAIFVGIAKRYRAMRSLRHVKIFIWLAVLRTDKILTNTSVHGTIKTIVYKNLHLAVSSKQQFDKHCQSYKNYGVLGEYTAHSPHLIYGKLQLFCTLEKIGFDPLFFRKNNNPTK